jgi:uncharacterized protein YdhG (YjbR/CyaY superfamily)
MGKSMKRSPGVDAYIASAPKEAQAKLRRIRAAIREAAPEAEERLSYGMPYYNFKGSLAYFRLAKGHIGFYVMPPVVKEHKRLLSGYETAKATIRFPLDEKIPVALVKKLVKAGVKKNEEKEK